MVVVVGVPEPRVKASLHLGWCQRQRHPWVWFPSCRGIILGAQTHLLPTSFLVPSGESGVPGYRCGRRWCPHHVVLQGVAFGDHALARRASAIDAAMPPCVTNDVVDPSMCVVCGLMAVMEVGAVALDLVVMERC